MNTSISPKVIASGFGTAVATIFWIIAAATFWKGVFTSEELIALTGASSVVIAGLLGYLVPDSARTVQLTAIEERVFSPVVTTEQPQPPVFPPLPPV